MHISKVGPGVWRVMREMLSVKYYLKDISWDDEITDTTNYGFYTLQKWLKGIFSKN